MTGTRTCEVEIESQLARYIEPSGSVGPPLDLARSQDRRTQNLGGGHAQKWTSLTFPILKHGNDRRSSQRSQNIVYCIYVFRRELSAQFPWWHSFQIAASHGILLPCEIVKHQFPASYLDFQGPRRAGDIQSSFCRCVAFWLTLSSLKRRCTVGTSYGMPNACFSPARSVSLGCIPHHMSCVWGEAGSGSGELDLAERCAVKKRTHGGGTLSIGFSLRCACCVDLPVETQEPPAACAELGWWGWMRCCRTKRSPSCLQGGERLHTANTAAGAGCIQQQPQQIAPRL